MPSRSASLVLLSILFTTTAFAQIERGQPMPRRAVLGVQLDAATAQDSAENVGKTKIVRVNPGTTAESIGLKAGDIVLTLNGKEMKVPADLTPILRLINGGDTMKVTVLRAGKTVNLEGKAIERPKQKGDGLVVEYDQVVSQGKRIRVIATHPTGNGPFPTIFWIGGIGAYSLDGEYANIAYGNVMGPLSKEYAIVRIDKPGMGDSEGPIYSELLFDVEQDAYLQAVRLAKTLPFVNKDKIAIVGHSMGGVFGPLVAEKEKVAGLAVSGTLVKTWMEYILENSRRQSLLAGAKPEDVDQQMIGVAAVGQHLFYEDMAPADIIAKYPSLKAAVNSQTPDGKTYSGVGLPFWQQLAKKNLAGAWMKTDAKVIALWGVSDFISTRADHEFIAEIMNQKSPGSAEFVPVPNSDHGFFNNATMKDSMQKWGRPGNAFNPNIIEILSEWLKKTIGA